MFYRIDFILKDGAAVDSRTQQLLCDFLCALMRNGQILRGYNLVRGKNYCAYVTMPEESSLDEGNDNKYVSLYRAEVSKIFNLSVHMLGVNASSMEYCSCKIRGDLEMQTLSGDIDSVFVCMNCGKPVPLYKLPHLYDDEENANVNMWQDSYSAMDTLWLESLVDRYTGRQLTLPDSVLNSSGRDIAAEMGKALGCRVYYNMYDDLGWYTKKPKWAEEDGQMVRICPSCGKLMHHYAVGGYKRELCDDCMLSSEPYEG